MSKATDGGLIDVRWWDWAGGGGGGGGMGAGMERGGGGGRGRGRRGCACVLGFFEGWGVGYCSVGFWGFEGGGCS